MSNPLSAFVAEGKRLIYSFRWPHPVPDLYLDKFIANQRCIGSFGNLIARAGILAYCYDSISKLTDCRRDWQAKIDALPPAPDQPNTRIIPQQLVDEDEQWLPEVDAYINLIYYEVTSLVDMLKQLRISIDCPPEVQFLVKVRDRFLCHVLPSGLGYKTRCSFSIPEWGLLSRDVVALNSWSGVELRILKDHVLERGSPAWKEQRKRNEDLILSKKMNEKLTQGEVDNLIAVGVRECNIELALNQLGELLELHVLPVIKVHVDNAMNVVGLINRLNDNIKTK